jgi:hypothetical protein
MKEKYAAALKRLEESGRRLDREAVVEAATEPRHPLHDVFNWDDAAAAHQHRLDQAGKLIDSYYIHIRHQDTTMRVKAYFKDVTSETGYRHTRAIKSDGPEVIRQTIIAGIKAPHTALTNMRNLAVYCELSPATLELFDQVLVDIAELITQLEAAKRKGTGKDEDLHP